MHPNSRKTFITKCLRIATLIATCGFIAGCGGGGGSEVSPADPATNTACFASQANRLAGYYEGRITKSSDTGCTFELTAELRTIELGPYCGLAGSMTWTGTQALEAGPVCVSMSDVPVRIIGNPTANIEIPGLADVLVEQNLPVQNINGEDLDYPLSVIQRVGVGENLSFEFESGYLTRQIP